MNAQRRAQRARRRVTKRVQVGMPGFFHPVLPHAERVKLHRARLQMEQDPALYALLRGQWWWQYLRGVGAS